MVHTRARGGFTLLELVLAMGIAAVIVYGLHHAVAMHYAQLEVGRRIAGHAQLVRALTDRIRQDVRATFTQYSPATDAGEEELVAGTTSGTVVSEYDVPAGGLLGDGGSITLVVGVPPGRLDPADASFEQAPRSDLGLVRYRLATGPPLAAGRASGSAGDAQPVGLIRERWDHLPSASATNLGEAGIAELLAEEVQSFSIRYFDGTDWHTEWGADATSAPLLVEIELGIVPLDRGGSGTRIQEVGAAGQSERHLILIALPTEAPTETEESDP